MLSRVAQWLGYKWRPTRDPALAQSYRITFSTLHGALVLQHLLDSVYCQVYLGTDPVGLAMHNGRRSVVQEILENIDTAEHPSKYLIEQEA